MNKRKRRDDALYKKNRLPAYERAGGLCENCGAPAAEIHHIVFRSQFRPLAGIMVLISKWPISRTSGRLY